jgi:hypothetical protein
MVSGPPGRTGGLHAHRATLAGLVTYDQSIDVSKYTLAGVTATSYCIQSPQGSGARVWRKNGPGAGIDNNHC